MSWVKDANRKYKRYQETRRGFRIYMTKPSQRHSYIVEREGEKWRRTDFIRGWFVAINKDGIIFQRDIFMTVCEDIDLYENLGVILDTQLPYNKNVNNQL